MQLTRLYLAWTIVLSISGCATAAAECAWVRRIQPSEQDIAAISRPLKEQIAAHNQKTTTFCR
jgi:hypothetical protein